MSTLPISDLTDAPDAARERRAFRILFVDDHPELRELMRIALQQAGYRITCSSDGEAALALLRADPTACDLLISDHRMPNMSGLEFVSAARRLPYQGRILIVSSTLTENTVGDYHRLGVDGFLFKPLFLGEVLQSIAGLLLGDGDRSDGS